MTGWASVDLGSIRKTSRQLTGAAMEAAVLVWSFGTLACFGLVRYGVTREQLASALMNPAVYPTLVILVTTWCLLMAVQFAVFARIASKPAATAPYRIDRHLVHGVVLVLFLLPVGSATLIQHLLITGLRSIP